MSRRSRRVLRNIWRVGLNVTYILIVLIVFSRLHARLEIIIVGLFGVTYAAIRTHSLALSAWLLSVIVGFSQELDAIRKSVDRHHETDTEAFEMGDARATSERDRFMIDGGGLSLIVLICLWQIFTVI